MIKKIILFCFIIFSMCSGVTAQEFEPDELINISVYEKINPAIVAIDANLDDGFSAGTGCVIRSDGVILTGSHVIEDATDIDVTTYNGKVYKAKILAKMGKNKDLALLKIDAKTPMKTISFGNSEEVKVGQKVLAIGNPFGFAGTLTSGIVSRIDYTKGRIQTDAAIPAAKQQQPRRLVRAVVRQRHRLEQRGKHTGARLKGHEATDYRPGQQVPARRQLRGRVQAPRQRPQRKEDRQAANHPHRHEPRHGQRLPHPDSG